MFEYHSINGNIVTKAQAQLDSHDIGFRRAYAAFDYLRVLNGQPIFIEDHLARFEHSVTVLRLHLSLSKVQLKEHILELIAKNQATEAGIQLFVTGGIASDGFSLGESQLLILMTVFPRLAKEAYEQGCKLIMHQYQRDLPEVKSSNYFMAVYLSKAMHAAGAADVLYHDARRVLESTRSNLFIVKADDSLVTADKDILPGITRKQILALAPRVTKLELRDVFLEELWTAKEVFLTSTTKGAMPVTQIGDKPIGSGKPGELTRQIRELFQKHLEAYMATPVN